MRDLLIINPNTSAAVSQRLLQHARATVGAGARVRVATAAFGAPYIADEASYAVAGHAALDAWQRMLAEGSATADKPPGAVLIGCFGDPGLWALREVCPCPVSGLAEAAFAAASRHGRFAVVTGGKRWRAMLQRLALALGHAEHLVDVFTVAPSGAELAADPEGALRVLAQACEAAAAQPGVRAVVLGGAGLAGWAARLPCQLDVPLIDSVEAGVLHALQAPR